MPPFSKLKPSEKFAQIMQESSVDLWDNCIQEFEFDDERKWRWDYCWPDQKVAVEVDGFGYGHQAQQSIARNNEKRNAAVSVGWRVFVFDSRTLGSRQGVVDAVDLVWQTLCNAGGE